MIETMRRHSITLALFAALATGVTSAIYYLTAPRIAHQAALQQKALLDQVISPDLYNNELQKECYVVTNSALGDNQPHHMYVAKYDNHPIAVAIESTAPDGYSGAIHLLIGVSFDGKILGTRVLEHHETPGLGDKIETRISDWILAFSGQSVSSEQDKSWNVRKDGGMFDQFTGATITPRAVVHAVKRTALYVQHNQPNFEELPACQSNQ